MDLWITVNKSLTKIKASIIDKYNHCSYVADSFIVLNKLFIYTFMKYFFYRQWNVLSSLARGF